MIILATFQKIHKVSKCTKTCNKNTFPSHLYPFQWTIRSWFINALIKLVTRAPSTRKRDLIAPTVSKMTPKMTSKVTPKMTSGTPSGALWSNPSPEGLGKGPGSPNAYKTNKKPPPEPVGQEGRKARQWCSVERLRLPAFFDASFGSMLYVHIIACNIFVIQMHWGIAITCNVLVMVWWNWTKNTEVVL